MITASSARRITALGLDSAILLAGLLLTVSIGVSLDASGVVDWLALAWVVVVAPLYFALYHGRSTGRTPGERELGVALLDSETGRRIGIGRALVHSFGGLLSLLLVVPLIADLLVFLFGSGLAWHERALGTRAVLVATEEPAWQRPPTESALLPAFDDAHRRRFFQRALDLVDRNRRQLVPPVLLLFVVLVLLTGLYGALLVADISDTGDLPDAGSYWTAMSLIVFGTGVFWSQAIIAPACDAVRTGQRVSALTVIWQAASRANAITVFAALAIGVPELIVKFAPTLAFVLLFWILLVVRFSMVVPILLLEQAPLLTAARRSWALTRRATWRLLGYLAASFGFLAIVISISISIGSGIAAGLAGTSALTLIVGAMIGLLIASAPVSFAVSFVGAAWYFVYLEQGSEVARASTD